MKPDEPIQVDERRALHTPAPTGGEDERKPIKQIVCPQCGQTFVPTAFTVRPVENYPTVKNVGLGCPHCDWFGHLFVEDVRQRRRRATVAARRRAWERQRTPGKWRQVEKAQAELERVFDEVQAKWRPLLGLTPFFEAASSDVASEGSAGAG